MIFLLNSAETIYLFSFILCTVVKESDSNNQRFAWLSQGNKDNDQFLSCWLCIYICQQIKGCLFVKHFELNITNQELLIILTTNLGR